MINKTIGFIGLGKMGFHMATHLLNADYKIIGYDIDESAFKPFADKNIEQVNSPQEVADKAEIVLVSLPTPSIVQKIVQGKNGVTNGKKIKVFIDLSTTGRTVSIEIGQSLLEKGIHMLDSPVSGGVIGAEKRTLSIVTSGKEGVYKECFPILNTISSNTIHVGNEIGQAQAMKVINNLLSSSALALTSEAVVLGVKAGLDPDMMIDYFNVSSGRNSATEDKFKSSIISRKFDYGFPTALAYKDVKLCLDLAEDLEVPMWLGSNMEHFWRYVANQAGPDEDNTSIIKHFEEWAGVKVVKNNN